MATIRIFSTPTCPYCEMAKSFLRERGVAYEETDVTQDPEGLAEMKRISGQMGVPVITDGETVVVGFRRDALEQMITA